MEESKEWLSDFVECCDQPSDSQGKRFDRNTSPVAESDSSPVNEVNGEEQISGSGGILGNIVNSSVLEMPIVGEDKGDRGEDFAGGIDHRKECTFTPGLNEEGSERQSIFDIFNKRKKYIQKLEVGQTSLGEYSSSNERPHKEPKQVEDDPFGLDPFILGFDKNVVKTRGQDPIVGKNSFQVLMEEHPMDIGSNAQGDDEDGSSA
ncbi:hypothetical protein Hanom_Chr10g00888741 [Helianthus anomalus]